MEFNKEKAAHIIKKYDLSQTTLRVWESRNAIPDKYADENYQPRQVISKTANIKHDRLVEVLRSGKIIVQNFAELAGVSKDKLNEAISSNPTLLSESDLKKCEVELKRMRIEVIKTFETFSPLMLKKLLKLSTVAYSVVINDKTLQSKVSQIRLGKTEPDKALWQQLKDSYIFFSIQISI